MFIHGQTLKFYSVYSEYFCSLYKLYTPKQAALSLFFLKLLKSTTCVFLSINLKIAVTLQPLSYRFISSCPWFWCVLVIGESSAKMNTFD